MDIKKLKVGEFVEYPEDRGAPKGIGKIISFGSKEYKNIYGVLYVWVTVKGPVRESVWPSNRLR
jgi:hypothetical protein